MRVRSWVMDGLDALPHVDSGELPNGLIVVYSDDPARKNTAIAAIRRILFSAPGNGQGRATALLSGANGDFELSTNGSAESETFRRVGGEPADLDDLGRLFGESERTKLRHVFDVNGNDGAFFAGDLAFAGPAAAGSELRARMAEILADDGRGELDFLIAELDQVEARLAAALETEQSYRQRLSEEREATNTVGRICAELAELRKQRERLKAYVALWPVWLRRAHLADELASMEEIDDFPDSDLSIVEAQQRAQAAETELHSTRKLHRQARAELETLPIPGDRHTVLGRVSQIYAELPSYRQRMTAFARARARHDELERLIPEIGRRVTPEDLDTPFDPNHLDLGATREWLNRSDGLAEREAVTRASLERTRASLKQLRNERQRAVRAAKTLTVQLDDADEHWRALWSLRDDLEHLWEIQSQGEAAARTSEQRQQSLESLDRRRYHAPPPALGKVLWVVVAAAFAAALWKTSQEDQVMALLLSGVAIVAALGDLAIGWRRRWAEVRNRDVVAKEDRLRYDLDRARQLRDARWRSADEITHRIESAAGALGLSRVPSVAEVDAAEEKLFEACRKLHQRGPLAETALAIHDHQEEEELFMAQLREIHQAKDAAALEWDEWKESVGLPAGLAQDDLTTYLCELDRWRELAAEAVEIDDELRRLAPEIEEWESKARDLLIDVGADIDDSLCGRDLEDQLTMLRDSAERSKRLAEKHRELGERVAELDAQLAESERRAADSRRLYDELRKHAGTGDEAEFERRKQVFLERRKVAEELRERENELVACLAEHRLADDGEVRADLARGNPDAWAEQSYDIDTEIERLEEAMEAASHGRTVAAAACREIEASHDVAVLRQELACLREEIQRLADEWRCLALADGLIAAASKNLSSSTAMLTAASDNLRKLTLGEMVRLAAPEGSDHLVVVDRSGEQHKVNGNLSAELTRQIQLSVQLTMVRDVARGRGPIPVVMDEVLRDLGPALRSATAAEIASLAEQQQVFYFTTDTASVEALEAAGEVSRVLKL